MKETGNAMIEEAFFILKPGYDKGRVSEEDILKHANSILSKSFCNEKFSSSSVTGIAREKHRKSAICFWSGTAVGAILAATILLII